MEEIYFMENAKVCNLALLFIVKLRCLNSEPYALGKLLGTP